MLGCGGGGDDPDARRPADAAATFDAAPADAAAKTYCIDQTDEDCDYVPAPVLPTEVSLAVQQSLAERYNPAHVYTGDDVWAVSVQYLQDDHSPLEGGVLMQAAHDGRLAFSYDVDVDTYAVVDPQPDLLEDDYTDLPVDNGEGRGLVYFIDGPGTGTGPGIDEETWSAAWRTIQGYSDPAANDPTAAAYPPFQYAHLFWLSKADDLLAIQYWFYYPYDKFTNNHEGDWEHVNVVLDYEQPSAPVIAMFQFSNHGKELGVAADQVYRVGDRDSGDGDHLVVFVGGQTCQIFDSDEWCGDTSGASFPYPGVYDTGQTENVAGGATRTGRVIHANDFVVSLLPRAEDIDFSVHGELSWYALPFLFGEPLITANDPVVISTNNHRSPVHPGPDHDEYDVGIEERAFAIMAYGSPEAFVVPSGWTMVNLAPTEIFE